MKLNWTKIKNEYINGNISYAKLAKKHNVSLQAIKDRGTKEKWVAQKKEQHAKIQQVTNQKTIEKIAEQQSDLAAEINSAAKELVAKIKEATKQLDMCIAKDKRKYTRQVVDSETGKKVYVDFEEETPKAKKVDVISEVKLKHIASALKDIHSISMAMQGDNPDNKPTITFVEDLEDE